MCEPKIYVADLAAYNAGYLHGAWIDAAQELNDIQDAVNAMLASSPVRDSEEYAIHDYEGFDGLKIKEYEGLKGANEKALFVEQHGKLGAEILNYFCGDMEDAQKALDDDYYGCYSSLADYVQELTEETTDIPDHLQLYIDYERMARDMEMSGDVYTIETAHDEVHVFWNR